MILAQLAACGGSEEAAADAQDGPPTSSPPSNNPPAGNPPPPNAAPTISGSPSSWATVGNRYEFRPQASDAEGATLSFAVVNRPAWSSFDGATGTLAGTPSAVNVGRYSGIVISVRDGSNVSSLPPFTIDVVAASAPSPYSGTPIPLPGTFEAEDFDLGGEGAAYHDLSASNLGREYRPDEAVDIYASADTLGGGHVVNNFETGEWVAYTIDVARTADYDISLRAASVFADSAFHVEIDGRDVTGQIGVPNTGDWSAFQWVGANAVSLTSGRHLMTVVADRQYFDLNSIRIAEPVVTPPPPPPPDPTAIVFTCTFLNRAADCGLEEQAKVPGRASLVSTARDGTTAVRLHTEPGDNNVAFSGEMERNDLWLSQAQSDGYEGREAWWAHSILFPTDFTTPTWQSYVVFDFHNSGSGPWQANFHVAFQRQSDLTMPGQLSLIGYGGVNSGDGRFQSIIGPITKNAWYDFVYHVRWSSGSDGFFDAWLNGRKILTHRGPTLYAGQGVYLKLANYHNPVCDPYPACIGTHSASSVIHDRVIRGTTPLAVSSGPLEGVLGLVNGVLTPILP